MTDKELPLASSVCTQSSPTVPREAAAVARPSRRSPRSFGLQALVMSSEEELEMCSQDKLVKPSAFLKVWL